MAIWKTFLLLLPAISALDLFGWRNGGKQTMEKDTDFVLEPRLFNISEPLNNFNRTSIALFGGATLFLGLNAAFAATFLSDNFRRRSFEKRRFNR